jgi:hypothetical protein
MPASAVRSSAPKSSRRTRRRDRSRRAAVPRSPARRRDRRGRPVELQPVTRGAPRHRDRGELRQTPRRCRADRNPGGFEPPAPRAAPTARTTARRHERASQTALGRDTRLGRPAVVTDDDVRSLAITAGSQRDRSSVDALRTRPERAHGRRRAQAPAPFGMRQRRMRSPGRCSASSESVASSPSIDAAAPAPLRRGPVASQARCSMHASASSSRSLATSVFKRRHRWAAGRGWSVGAHDGELLGHTRPRVATASRPVSPPARRPPCRRTMRGRDWVVGGVRWRLASKSLDRFLVAG